jgi:hypothetical protein
LFDPDFYPKPYKNELKHEGIVYDRETRVIALSAAKQICFNCPLSEMCLQVALTYNETAMIWGGFTPEEREKMPSIRKPPIKTP